MILPLLTTAAFGLAWSLARLRAEAIRLRVARQEGRWREPQQPWG